MLSISSARQLAVANIQNAQRKYKRSYDQHANCRQAPCKIADWVLVHCPQEETGGKRKLSRPWHGPYRVTSQQDPDVCVVKVYFPQDHGIRIHQSRVKLCPPNFPAGFYWYGGKRRGPGRPPKWVTSLADKLLPDTSADPVDKQWKCSGT